MIEAFAGLVVLTVLAAVLCGLLLGLALLGRAVLGGPDGDVLGFVGGVAVPLLRFAAAAVLVIWLFTLLR